MLKPQPPVPQNVTIREYKSFTEVIKEAKVKFELLGWALIPSDWCLYKNRIVGYPKRQQGYVHTGQPREEAASRPTSQGERSQKDPILPAR